MSPQLIAAPRELRTANRAAVRLQSPCRLRTAVIEGPWWTTVRNISANGIAVVADRPVQPGALLAVELPALPGRPRELRLMWVTHAEPRPHSGWWSVGGAFTQPLAHDQLTAVQARESIIAPAVEHRLRTRHATRLTAPTRMFACRFAGGPYWATIRNLSRGGIGLIADRGFRPGSLLTVELPQGYGLAAPRLLRLTYASPQPGGRWWKLGGTVTPRFTSEEVALIPRSR